MSERWLQQACRVYSGLVIAVAFFSIAVFAGGWFPRAIRGSELVLAKAEDIAVWSAVLSLLVGGLMCGGCLWSKAEPSDLLVNRTLIAVVLCIFTIATLPAIVRT
jgi:hypothetical protein